MFQVRNMTRFGDFDGLALFTRIVEAGGLAAAERATGIPKATLSRRLTALEQALSVRLVRRTKKGVVLTDDGQRLYDQGRAAIMLAEQAIAEVQDERVVLSGAVRISLPPDIGEAALAPALIRFKELHEKVVVELTLDDRRVSLIEEGYDLVVRMGSLADSGLISRKITTLQRTLVASPGFLSAHTPIRTVEDIESLPALAISRDTAAWELTRSGGEIAIVHPRIGFAANRQTILVGAAIAGVGIAVLPAFLVQDAVRSGELVRVLPDWEPRPVDMTALWQQDKITSRLVAAIVAEFVHLFARSDADHPRSYAGKG
jgi:DNA-binding transcriptional LysR family regulator